MRTLLSDESTRSSVRWTKTTTTSILFVLIDFIYVITVWQTKHMSSICLQVDVGWVPWRQQSRSAHRSSPFFGRHLRKNCAVSFNLSSIVLSNPSSIIQIHSSSLLLITHGYLYDLFFFIIGLQNIIPYTQITISFVVLAFIILHHVRVCLSLFFLGCLYFYLI